MSSCPQERLTNPETKGMTSMDYKFSLVTPEIVKLAERSIAGYRIDPELYTQYDVKRGLRDINGNGVPDSTDALTILKYIVGLIKTL